MKIKKAILYPLAVLVLVSLACELTPSANASSKATGTPVLSSTEEGIPTAVEATAIPEATDLPTLEAPAADAKTSQEGNYHDEFSGTTNNWNKIFVTGNTMDNAQVLFQGGRLHVELAPHEEAHLKMFETTHNYQDVIVSTEFENFGNNTNGVSVLCRVSKKGWYEFRVSTGGLYLVQRYDQELKDAGQNPYVTIAQGGSSLIKAGLKKNKISMSCVDAPFRFFINDVELTKEKLKIPPTKMDEFNKLGEGTTGLGVYAESNTASSVKVEFISYDAKMPEK
jgi:hypothetical protein